MMKNKLRLLSIVLLTFLMLFSIPASAIAATSSPLKSEKMATQKTYQNLVIPDQKAIVEIKNKDTNELIEITLYLTPGTTINDSTFQTRDYVYGVMVPAWVYHSFRRNGPDICSERLNRL